VGGTGKSATRKVTVGCAFNTVAVAVDSDDRHADKAQRQHVTQDVTSYRKRKWSNVDDDYRRWSRDDVGRCAEVMPAGERSVAVAKSPGIVGTPSSCAAVARSTRSPAPATDDEPQPQVPAVRPPINGSKYSDDHVSCLPLGVVGVWHKNWSGVGAAPRLLVESSLCRESFLPVLLVNAAAAAAGCTLSN